MLAITLLALFLTLGLLASLLFITGGIIAARSDARDEQLYRTLLSADA